MIPKGVKRLEGLTFSGCTGLKSIINKGIEYVDVSAFSSLFGVGDMTAKVFYEGTYLDWRAVFNGYWSANDIYFYSENNPSLAAPEEDPEWVNYWHYDEGTKLPVIWSKEEG